MVSNKIKLTPKSILIIGIISFILLVITISIIYLSFNKKSNNNDQSTTNSYVDPGSGETVYNPPNKANEKTNSSNDIIYLGFTNLLNKGLTDIQYKKLKTHFRTYSTLNNLSIKEISVTTSSIKHILDQSSGKNTLTFTTTINRKSTLDAKITYSGLYNIDLFLYNPKDSKQVFTSVYNGQ